MKNLLPEDLSLKKGEKKCSREMENDNRRKLGSSSRKKEPDNGYKWIMEYPSLNELWVFFFNV